MVRMGVGADDQIDVRDCQPQRLEALLNMVEQSAVTRVYQHPAGAVNEIGVAVVGGHGLPNKGMQVVEYFQYEYPYSFTGSNSTVQDCLSFLECGRRLPCQAYGGMRLKIADRINVFTKFHGTVLSLSLLGVLIDHKKFFINIYDWISHILCN